MNPVVHLELHTGDLPGARATYAHLCGWRAEQIQTGNGPYMSLRLGGRFGGGIVECGTPRAMWLPYVQVGEIEMAAARARELGASMLPSRARAQRVGVRWCPRRRAARSRSGNRRSGRCERGHAA